MPDPDQPAAHAAGRDGRRPWWWSRLVRPRLGVVLSGGATMGAFQVGVIDVMARRGVVPDLLVGTSVGAINAAFWAFYPGLDVGSRLLEFWLESSYSTMIPDGAVWLIGRLLSRQSHLTTQQGVRRAIEVALPPDAQVQGGRVPLAIVCTELEHGERAVLRAGPLLESLLASTAIPGLFPPLELGGRWLMDGGVVANCDIDAALEAGMTDVLAIDVMGPSEVPGQPDVWEVTERVVRIMLRRQTDLALRIAGRPRARIAVLRPTIGRPPRLTDFGHTTELYRLGQAAGEAFLAAHLAGGRRVRPGVYVHVPPPARDASAGMAGVLSKQAASH